MSKNADRFQEAEKEFDEEKEGKHKEKRDDRHVERKISAQREDKNFWQWFCSLFGVE